MTTKTSNILFAALAATIMLSFPMMGIDAAVQESQKKQKILELREKAGKLDHSSKEFFDLIKRDELSDAEMKQAKNIMRDDDRLRQMIDDDTLEIMSVSFVGNANTLPVKWHPVVHTTDGAEITAVKLDLDANEIKSMDTYERQVLGLNNAYAVAEYSGTPNLVKGIAVTSESQPVNYNGSSTYSEFSALLLNAQMYGSVRANLCSAAYFPSSYWLQVGTGFHDSGWGYVYADTTTNCISNVITIPEPLLTHDVNYKIYSDSTWYVVLHNEDTNDFGYYQRSGMNSGWIEVAAEATSVFFENGYTGSGWDSQFVNGDLSRTDAQVLQSDDSWVSWNSDTQYVLDCNGNELAGNVTSGTLQDGGTTTWDISEMTNWPNC